MESQLFFGALWILNFVSIRLLGTAFNSQIFLGNFKLSPADAAVYSGFWLTFFVWTMREYLKVLKVEYDPPNLRVYTFLFINILGVWIISRYSQYTGLGITSFWLAVTIGGGAALLQLTLWRIFGKNLKE